MDCQESLSGFQESLMRTGTLNLGFHPWINWIISIRNSNQFQWNLLTMGISSYYQRCIFYFIYFFMPKAISHFSISNVFFCFITLMSSFPPAGWNLETLTGPQALHGHLHPSVLMPADTKSSWTDLGSGRGCRRHRWWIHWLIFNTSPTKHWWVTRDKRKMYIQLWIHCHILYRFCHGSSSRKPDTLIRKSRCHGNHAHKLLQALPGTRQLSIIRQLVTLKAIVFT